MGWNRSEIVNLRHAAHLHDIGKVGIPDIILNKPSRLTNEEYAVIKEHTVIGAEILKNVSLINHVTEVARSHHERYDGHGYPDGLKGEEIPIHARIVAVADSYDAMNSAVFTVILFQKKQFMKKYAKTEELSSIRKSQIFFSD